MASIRKFRGKWQVQIRRKGFPSKSRTFTRKSDALEWSRQTELQADRRELPNDTAILWTRCTKMERTLLCHTAFISNFMGLMLPKYECRRLGL